MIVSEVDDMYEARSMHWNNLLCSRGSKKRDAYEMMFNLSYTVLGESIGREAPRLASYVSRLNPIKSFFESAFVNNSVYNLKKKCLHDLKIRKRDVAVKVTNNMLQKVWSEFEYRPDNFRVTRPAHTKVHLT